jgi:hypothetical protein
MAQDPKLTSLGKVTVLLIVVACIAAAWVYWRGGLEAALADLKGGPGKAGTPAPRRSGGAVEIGVAYGTEKRPWMEWAAKQFATTEAGACVTVSLKPMGSLEGAQALLKGDEGIHLWSPASSAYTGTFTQDWLAKHGKAPFVRQEDVALTPMVFVLWEERYQAFVRRYGSVRFDTLRQALQEGGGWKTIVGKPEWGLFKLGHTHPAESNSGLLTLVAMAYEKRQKCRGLQLADVLDPEFQTWLGQLERAVTGLSNSTGTMMREMILKGPSAFDALFVYENVAIENLSSAEGRWGSLRVVYPERNLWNENPCYVVDAPWSSPAQRAAASAFVDFLLAEPAQREALVHGFRPVNLAVPVKSPDSPFMKAARYGVQADIGSSCEAPAPEVSANLLALWQRSFAGS